MEMQRLFLNLSTKRDSPPRKIKWKPDPVLFLQLQRDFKRKSKSIFDETFSPSPRAPKTKRSKLRSLINIQKQADELPLTIHK